ncbi:hypothetical protein CC79DRAFT_1375741 [Sarocladium strictum]
MLSKTALLSILAVSADALNTLPWEINTYDNADCSGPAASGFTGEDILDKRVDCYKTHFPKSSKSVWFRDSATAAHVLKLHAGDECSDNDEVVSIPADAEGVCVQLDTSNGFSLARADGVAVRQVRRGWSGTSDLSTRQNQAEFYAWFHTRRQAVYTHVAATVAACSILNWVACGFGILITTVETAFLAWEVHKYTAHRAGNNKRSLAEELLDGPIDFSDYIEGKTVRVHGINMADDLSRRDSFALMGRDIDEDSHLYMQMDYIDDLTGEVESVLADLDLDTNMTIASAPADKSKFGKIGSGDLARRQQASDYTIHYQSMSMSERAQDLFPISREQADHLANDIWVWGAEQNIGGHCAALLADGDRLNSGYFSIRTGGFTAHRDCENV